MNPIRLVALDLDGTLLDSGQKIPEQTLAAVAAAAAGVRFVLATGRMYAASAPFAAELGLVDAPLVTYDGALVRLHPSGRDLLHRPLPPGLARSIAAWAEGQGIYAQAYVDDRLYVPALVPVAEQYSQRVGVPATPVGPLSSWLERPATKLLLVLEPDRLDPAAAKIAARFPGQAECHQSLGRYLEVVAPGVNKATGLAQAAEYLGIPRGQVLAVGDDANDLAMLQWAGAAVAMSHAPAAVRAAADYIASAGPGHGVAEALQHYGLYRG